MLPHTNVNPATTTKYSRSNTHIWSSPVRNVICSGDQREVMVTVIKVRRISIAAAVAASV